MLYNGGCCFPGPELLYQPRQRRLTGRRQHQCMSWLCQYVAPSLDLIVSPFQLSYVPSETLPVSNLDGESARYFNVTLGSPSRIMRWVTMRALKTMVHVESRRRCWRVRNTSATPPSPAWVATRIVSTYLALGAASFVGMSNTSSSMFLRKTSPLSWCRPSQLSRRRLTLLPGIGRLEP